MDCQTCSPGHGLCTCTCLLLHSVWFAFVRRSLIVRFVTWSASVSVASRSFRCVVVWYFVSCCSLAAADTVLCVFSVVIQIILYSPHNKHSCIIFVTPDLQCYFYSEINRKTVLQSVQNGKTNSDWLAFWKWWRSFWQPKIVIEWIAKRSALRETRKFNLHVCQCAWLDGRRCVCALWRWCLVYACEDVKQEENATVNGKKLKVFQNQNLVAGCCPISSRKIR